jgi:hypothetical protein
MYVYIYVYMYIYTHTQVDLQHVSTCLGHPQGALKYKRVIRQNSYTWWPNRIIVYIKTVKSYHKTWIFSMLEENIKTSRKVMVAEPVFIHK